MSKKAVEFLGHENVAEHIVGSVSLTAPVKRIMDDDYVIYLINMSDRTFVMGCYNFNPNGNNNWFPIPHTGRTCSSDCGSCHDNQQWQAIMNVNCRESFDLTLATAPDQNGKVWGARWQVTPDCQYSGGSLCTA
jgi:hypothetical protein